MYSLSEARDQLSALVERALRGEKVIITRYGQPLIELTVIGNPDEALRQDPDAETTEA